MNYKINRRNRKTGRIWQAYGVEENGEFILKKGSIISDIELKRLPKKIKEMRDRAPINDDRILTEDLVFKNKNDAAAFVLATNASGEREWKINY